MLASAVVKVARDKLVNALRLGDAAAATMPDDEKLRRHMEELKQRMEAMAEVVGDAEGRSKRDMAVREWLIRLEDAAYGIWDMVDELQANQWKPVTEIHRPWLPIATARKGRSMVTRMLKAKENLDELLQSGLQATSLAFRRDVDKGKLEQSVDDAYPATPSFADNNEDYIVGRDQEKLEIMDTILSAESDSSRGLFIIAIVGMGGIGKTTLAKMVFSDTTTTLIRDYARAWVTVGDEFDLKKIGNHILSQLSNKGEHQDSSDVELIMQRLDKLLLGGGRNKLLLVADDIWEQYRETLDVLRHMLGEGKEDRKVILLVTTRNEGVARALDADIHRVAPLSKEDSCHLLKQKIGFATRSKDATTLELEQLLCEITIKCAGIPLLIHAIGSTLRSKSPQEIRSVLNSDILKSEDTARLLPALVWSYQCMPPNLRLCFAHCAIFPRDHNIPKDDLIHHWMALQLIEPSDRLSARQLANRYIDMLLDMAFLQRTMQPSDHRCPVSFTVHDLPHDIAMSVSSEKCIVLDSTNSYQRFSSKKNRYRQARLTNSGVSDPVNLSDILSAWLVVLLFHGCSDNKQLSDDSFSSAKYLRVLDLRDCWLQKLPDSICQLGQLRYLNLSGSTKLVSLPDSFGNLINLGHIDLSSCSGLLRLPDSFGNLTSVMHINLSGCVGLKSLTESFGNLKNAVHVNLSGCVGLKSLPESFGLLENLEYLDLSSCSCIEGIPSVVDGLTNLQHLNLSHPCCYFAQHRFHLRALKDVWVKLTNLRYLNLSMCLNPIFCYLPEQERIKYIESISCLHALEHLDLSHNIFLFDIPQSLGQLSQLQTLNLFGCARLKRIEKWMGEKKLLGLSNCLGLETYQFGVRTDGGTKSSNLAQLKVVSCKELEINCLEKVISTKEVQSIGLAEKKKLQKLTLVWSTAPDDASFNDHQALLAVLVPPQNLHCFELHGYSSEYLPAWLTSRLLFSYLPNLVEVSLVDIPSCGNLPPFGVLPNLQRLILRRVAKVTRIDADCLSGGSKAAFHRLLHVTLDGMVNLEEFSNCSSSDELVMFPALDELVINKCPKLRFGDPPPKARMLVISDCDQLMTSPVKRRGDNAVEGPSSSTCTTSSPMTEVVIESCKVPLDELNWNLLQGLAPLHSLHIRNCSEKIISPEIMKGHLSSLKLLCFSHCDSMTTLPEHVVQVQDTSLQELIIHECRGIKSLPQIICEEKKKHNPHGPPTISESEEKKKHYALLRIRGCPELKQWCELENKMKLAHIQIIFEESGTSV